MRRHFGLIARCVDAAVALPSDIVRKQQLVVSRLCIVVGSKHFYILISFTLLHALSLECAAEAEPPPSKNRASLKRQQSDGDHYLTLVSSLQNEL